MRAVHIRSDGYTASAIGINGAYHLMLTADDTGYVCLGAGRQNWLRCTDGKLKKARQLSNIVEELPEHSSPPASGDELVMLDMRTHTLSHGDNAQSTSRPTFLWRLKPVDMQFMQHAASVVMRRLVSLRRGINLSLPPYTQAGIFPLGRSSLAYASACGPNRSSFHPSLSGSTDCFTHLGRSATDLHLRESISTSVVSSG